MGLMDTLQSIIDLCISIQESLSLLIDMIGHVNGFQKSMVDLSAIDVIALEKNVKILAGVSEDIDYIISKLTELSGNIQLLFWLILAVALLILGVVLFFIFKIVYENRQKIFDWFERKSNNEKNNINRSSN